MENPRPEKVAVVDEVRERISSSSAVLLTEYRGLRVSELAALRRNVTEAGGDYKIYKNTLVRFAVRDLGLESVEELLVGPTALTFVDGDPVAVAKALRDYGRTNPSLVVKGGLLQQRLLNTDEVRALADVPPREELLARLAGALAAPMQQLAGLMQALPRNLAYALQALVDKRGGVEEPAAAADEPAPVAGEPAAAEEPAAEDAASTPEEPVAAEEPAGEPAAAEEAASAPETTDASAAPANAAEVAADDEPVTEPAAEVAGTTETESPAPPPGQETTSAEAGGEAEAPGAEGETPEEAS